MKTQAETLLSSVSIDEEGCLDFHSPFLSVIPSIRDRKDLAEVFMAEGANVEEGVAYRMYRGVCTAEDRAVFEEYGTRHDLTAISPGTVHGEFMKTYGHYHPASQVNGVSYPEVYEVVYGQGYFLMQRTDANGKVTDVYVVEGRQGQKVIIPPDYGHVTVNASEGWLVIANLVADGWNSTYEAYRRLRGAAYYALKGYRKTDFVPNPRYGNVPPLRRVAPGGLAVFGATDETTLYSAFTSNPHSFDFLVNPERYPEQFRKVSGR